MFSLVKKLLTLQVFAILATVIAIIYYPETLNRLKHAVLNRFYQSDLSSSIELHFTSNEPVDASGETLLTATELATFNGEANAPLYLALLGSVYDVSKGMKHYGPGCSYNFFVGRDASVSFITGQFESSDSEDELDDVLKLKSSDLLSLSNWKSFYDKTYTYKGRLIGRFYDNNGVPTAYHSKFLALINIATQKKVDDELLRTKYPDCNIEWSESKGTRVWCTISSGGKQRAWIGHPRKLFEIGKETFRCACIEASNLDATDVMLKPYDNCERLANECFYRV